MGKWGLGDTDAPRKGRLPDKNRGRNLGRFFNTEDTEEGHKEHREKKGRRQLGGWRSQGTRSRAGGRLALQRWKLTLPGVASSVTKRRRKFLFAMKHRTIR